MASGRRPYGKSAVASENTRRLTPDVEFPERAYEGDVHDAWRESQPWKQLLECAADGYMVVDSQWKVILTSKKDYYQKYNLEKVGIAGRSLLELMPGVEKTVFFQQCQEILEGRKVGVVETFMSRPTVGGVYQDEDILVKAVKMGDGLGFVITHLTERRRAEKALRTREQQYRLLAENVSDVIWTMDMKFHTTYVSPSVERLVGYAVEEAMALRPRAFLAPNLAQVAKDTIGDITGSKNEKQTNIFRSWTLELELIQSNGATLWTESKISLLYDPSGRPYGILGVTREITERRQAEELFRNLADNSTTGVYIIQDRKFRYANPWLLKQVELSNDDFADIDYMSFVLPQDRSKVRENAIKMLKGERKTPYNYRIVNNYGQVRWIMETVTSIQYNGDRATLGNLMDISKHKHADEILKRSESQLRLLSKRIIEVQEEGRTQIARELHDQLGQEFFAAKIEAESLAEQLKDVPKLGARAMALANLVDRLSRTSHRIAASLRPVVLDELGLVKAVQWYAEYFERRSGISCPVETPSGELLCSKPTATCAYRILQEALTNVWKHAKASQAKVVLNATHRALRLSVSDNGVGVDLNRLTDASSLGLLGMRERARLVGGRLTIQSKTGKGMRVGASLPIYTD